MKRQQFRKFRQRTAYIAIDNGTTGAIAVKRGDNSLSFMQTPVFSDIEYTKSSKNVTRLDCLRFMAVLEDACRTAYRTIVLIERPMINPKMFIPSMSAIRCLEAMLICMAAVDGKYHNIHYRFIDSREWQGVVIPQATVRRRDDPKLLKQASTEKAMVYFPSFIDVLLKHDGDAPCILLYMMEQTKWLAREEWRIPGQRKKVVLDGCMDKAKKKA